MSEKNIKSFIDELIKEVEDELDEANVTGNVDGYDTPHAFSGKNSDKKRKKTATQFGYTLVNNDINNIDESINEDTKRVNILGIDFNISEMNGRIFFSFIDKKAASIKIREIGTNKIVNLIQNSLDKAYGKGEFFFKGGDHAEFQNGYLFQRSIGNIKLNKLKFESINEALKHLIHVETPTQIVSKPVAKQILALAKKGVRSYEIGLNMGFVGNQKAAVDAFQKVKNKIYFELDKREGVNEALDPKAEKFLDAIQVNDRSIKDLKNITVDATPQGNWSVYYKGKRMFTLNGKMLDDKTIMKYGLEHMDESINELTNNERQIKNGNPDNIFYIFYKGQFAAVYWAMNPSDLFKIYWDEFKVRRPAGSQFKLNPEFIIVPKKEYDKSTSNRYAKLKPYVDKFWDKLQNESVNEGKTHKPVNRWLELKNDESMHANKKLATGLRELKYQLKEVETFFRWYNQIKTMNELSSDTFWKRTHGHIYKIKERLINIAKTIQEIEK